MPLVTTSRKMYLTMYFSARARPSSLTVGRGGGEEQSVSKPACLYVCVMSVSVSDLAVCVLCACLHACVCVLCVLAGVL